MSELTCGALRAALLAVASSRWVRLTLAPGRLTVEGASPYLLVRVHLPAPGSTATARACLDQASLARLVRGLPPTPRQVGGMAVADRALRVRATGRDLAVPAGEADEPVWPQVDRLGQDDAVEPGPAVWGTERLAAACAAAETPGGASLAVERVRAVDRVLLRARATCPAGILVVYASPGQIRV